MPCQSWVQLSCFAMSRTKDTTISLLSHVQAAQRERNWRKASRATLFLAANRRHIFTILRWCHINLQHEVSSLLASSRPPTHTMIIAHCAVRSRRSANYLMRAPRAALCLSNSNNTRERSMCRFLEQGKKVAENEDRRRQKKGATLFSNLSVAKPLPYGAIPG